MDELKINPKFKELLPALMPEEFQQLEESIIKNGCDSPLMLWRGFIIDGHNRYEICTKNDLSFATIDRTFDFESEDDVLEWIYINQLGRRNLSDHQKTFYIGRLYNFRKNRHGGDRKSSGNNDHLKSKEAEKPEKTSEIMAKEFGLGEKTIRTAGKIAEAIEVLPEETKSDFLAGKITQKEVIEKATPKDTQKTDEFTEAVRNQAATVEKKMRLLNAELKKLSQLFERNDCDLTVFAPTLAKQFQLNKAIELRRFGRCECEQGCELCSDTGYKII